MSDRFFKKLGSVYEETRIRVAKGENRGMSEEMRRTMLVATGGSDANTRGDDGIQALKGA